MYNYKPHGGELPPGNFFLKIASCTCFSAQYDFSLPLTTRFGSFLFFPLPGNVAADSLLLK